MAIIKHDISLARIRKAAGNVATEARRKAFKAGTTVVYSHDGQIIRESADGCTIVVRSSQAGEVNVRKRTWKLK